MAVHPLRTTLELGLLAGLVYVGFNLNSIFDEVALRTFHPAPAMASLIDAVGPTHLGKGMLYRSMPQLDSKAAFTDNCAPQQGELELGCYYRGRIYILKIANTDLAPEMETVLAHETLHAAWSRLSSDEQTRLGELLEAVYQRLNDPELQARMASYARTEPGQHTNELHSILGTEYAQLDSPELEAHYRQYFTDRQVIVAAHERYQSVFSTRKAALDRELATIQALKGQLAALNAQMSAYKASGNISAYNALVPRQNALANDVNARIDQYRTDAEEYNALSISLDATQVDPNAAQ